MGKRILITGANGFIGSSLMQILVGTNWEIITLVRKKFGFEKEIIADFHDTDFNTIIDSLPKVDSVVHLGAKIDWDGSSKKDLFIPNVLATSILANWANRIGAYFLFASTAIVCGVKNPYISLNSKPNPDTDYGYSKWIAEERIKMSGVKHTILRIAGVFGKNGPHHLGINKAIDDVLHGIVPIQYGDGLIKRNYIYVKGLANVIKFCIDNEIEHTHLVAGSSINSISKMLQIICNVMLPNKKPEYHRGKRGNDQIIEHSAHLPKGHSFEEAIKDINRFAK